MHKAAFCPGHITGLFYIPEQEEDILKKGSLGAGFSIDKGVKTICTIEEGNGIEVYINNKREASPTLNLNALMLFEREAGKLPKGKLIIKHESQIPIGCGLGTSGAAAISLLLALNALTQANIDELKLYQLAHKAEILAGTGLGTVLGQYTGGCKISTKAGAPGIGEALTIKTNNMRIVAAILGPMLTSEALSSPAIKQTINAAGKKLHTELSKNPTAENLIKTSALFSEQANLYTDTILPLHTALSQKGIAHSMLMFGQGIYSICKEEDTQKLADIYRQNCPNDKLHIFNITEERGKLL